MNNQSLELGQKWLENFLVLAGFPTTVTPQINGNNLWLSIDHEKLTPTQIELLIGTEGATIDAIQYLANSIFNLNQPEELQTGFTIEINNYRQRRATELQNLADYAAQQVRITGREFVMQPLSSAERRQLHSLFETAYSDLETYSRGQEPDRRLVVRLIDMSVNE